MSAYMIIDIDVIDDEKYSAYIAKVPEIIKKYGGRYLARGGKVVPLTQHWDPKRVVLVEFPSLDAVKQCLSSAEYKEIAPLREASTVSKAIVVEG